MPRPPLIPNNNACLSYAYVTSRAAKSHSCDKTLLTLRRPGRICFHVATEVCGFHFQPDQVWSVNVGVSGWHKQWSLTMKRNDRFRHFHMTAQIVNTCKQGGRFTQRKELVVLPHTELNINRDGLGTTEPIAPWLWLAKRKERVIGFSLPPHFIRGQQWAWLDITIHETTHTTRGPIYLRNRRRAGK
jgi:hypothetical protein